MSVDSVGVTLKDYGLAGSTWGINREYVCICGICVYVIYRECIGKYNKTFQLVFQWELYKAPLKGHSSEGFNKG